MNNYSTNFGSSGRNSSDIVKYLRLYFGVENYSDDHIFTSNEIFSLLKNNMCKKSFGSFLTKLIASKNDLVRSDDTAEAAAYCADMFRKKRLIGAESLFDPEKTAMTSELLRKQMKNWFGNVVPSRENIFLLAFALDFDCTELSNTLTKGICDKNVNYKNAAEVTAFYCIKNHMDYFYALELIKKARQKASPKCKADSNVRTDAYKAVFDRLTDDESLVSHAARLISEAHDPTASVSAKQCYDRLLKKISASAIMDKRITVENETGIYITHSESISFGTAERFIYYYTPIKNGSGHYKTDTYAVYGNGNIKGKQDNLMKDSKWFFSTLLRRSDLKKMYEGQKRITRDTIITMAFFCVCEENPSYGTYEYISDINDHLNYCRFEQLNFSYPYDLFIFMCLQTEDPIAGFRTIWNMSWIK